ncbi:hypothetical protein [Deinococcus aquiradiocola]|uniref:Uncharacterized protein n=1 Tax=Deinococcus aquiradiocola TaxID=393059 RepID=A0A917UTH3_9DEIO|nr:hypothetical protein [Deinococcus aquiradiocola]GGJ84681.1 hypothetical protein GCM10008939_30710 [Deinococcus aquiradiocola]
MTLPPRFRRPGWSDEPWLHCPRCRHPLIRWHRYTWTPERPQVVWDPDRWLLPFPVMGAVLMTGLILLCTELLLIGGLGRGRVLLWTVTQLGLLWATAVAWVDWRWRLQRRAHLRRTLQPHDWVCARCLHSEPDRADLYLVPQEHGAPDQP